MKYILKFKLEKNCIRKDYRSTIISFFKKSISNYMNGHFYNEFYNEKANKKSLVWSIKFVEPKFEKNQISLGSNLFDITLRIQDEKTALVYYSSILGMKNVDFNLGNDNKMILTQIKMVRDSDITSDVVEFKIFSPVCLRQHNRETNNDRYICIEDEDFGIELNKKLKEDLEFFDREINSLLFNFDGLRKTVVNAHGLMFPVTIGSFIVKGNPNVLNMIKNRGIGSRRNSGFGLIEPYYK
mgnify:CR=1 FL=1